MLNFSIACLYTSAVRAFTYGQADATITSVETRERQGGTRDDLYFYMESNVTCSYTVNGHMYQKTFTIKADYSDKVGSSITILYNKSNPYESIIGTHIITAVLGSALFTIGSIYFIFFNIRKWIKLRKKERRDI